MAKRSIEPFLWLLFSAGGVLAALVLPILLLLFGVVVPLGWLPAPTFGHLSGVLHNPLTRVVLFLVCLLGLFHWAHRFRYTLYDGLQIKHLNVVINLACYGGAIVGSVVALSNVSPLMTVFTMTPRRMNSRMQSTTSAGNHIARSPPMELFGQGCVSSTKKRGHL